MSLSIAMIQEEVAAYFGLAPIEMRSRRRTVDVVRPRQVAMLLASELTGHSYPVIGRHFGNRDRTTITEAVGRMKDMCALANDVAELRNRLEQYDAE